MKMTERYFGHLRRVLISARHLGAYFLVTVLTWLIQVTLMPYLRNDALPLINLCFCTVGVMTVCYGKTRAYITGAVYGILYETMLPTVPMLNLLFFPVSALVCSVFFADRSEQRLTEMRATNPNARNDRPYLRTVCCAVLNAFFYETVILSYIYLNNIQLTAAHFTKSLTILLITAAVTLPLAWLERHFLGFPGTRTPTSRPGYYLK